MLPPLSKQVFSLEEEQLAPLIDAIIPLLKDKKILLLRGDLGAGKTSLVKNLLLKMDGSDPVSSPSFSIVNTYQLQNKNTVYHIDLYRLKNIEEFWNMGGSEYISGSSLCIIEWPELLLPYLDVYDYVDVSITSNPTFNGRIYTLIY